LRNQNRPKEAVDRLAKIFDWFTKGHSALDLQQAKEFLREKDI
jgi:hypothetical protein